MVHPSQLSRVLDDRRVSRGTARMLDARRRRLEAGERHAGWKLAFAAPAAQDRFRISAPVVGFFTDHNVLPDGGRCAVGAWSRPAIEPEIAVYLGADVPGGAGRAQAAAAIAGLGPAIEVADLAPELTDLEEILATGLYNRHVVLGSPDRSRAGARVDGLRARVTVDGVLVEETDDPVGFCGELVGLVRHVATVLAGVGERLSAGDVIIAGSVTPIVLADAGQHVEVDLGPLGALQVDFVAEEARS